MEELKDIEPVATLGGEPLYTAEQMQEYAKSKALEALKIYGIQESWWSEEETLKRYELVAEDLFKEAQDEEV